MELDAVLGSVARTGALVTAEEGTLTGGFGAEIAARVGGGSVERPARAGAARSRRATGSSSARPLEDDMLRAPRTS